MTIKLEAGTIATLCTTEFNALANGSRVIGTTAFDNAAAANLDFWALFELTVTWAVAPTNGAFCPLYLIPAPDGTNYVNSGTANDPASELFIGNFSCINVTTTQRMAVYAQMGRFLPTLYKPFIRNGSGQAFPATGSLLKILPSRMQ